MQLSWNVALVMKKTIIILRKIKARNEKIWIFFGIITANAMKIGKRRFKKQQEIQQNQTPGHL